MEVKFNKDWLKREGLPGEKGERGHSEGCRPEGQQRPIPASAANALLQPRRNPAHSGAEPARRQGWSLGQSVGQEDALGNEGSPTSGPV